MPQIAPVSLKDKVAFHHEAAMRREAAAFREVLKTGCQYNRPDLIEAFLDRELDAGDVALVLREVGDHEAIGELFHQIRMEDAREAFDQLLDEAIAAGFEHAKNSNWPKAIADAKAVLGRT